MLCYIALVMKDAQTKNTRPSFFLRERVFSCVRDISVNEYLFVIVYADGA